MVTTSQVLVIQTMMEVKINDLPFGNDNSTMYIGEQSANNYHMDGYLAEFNIIDGQQLLPASFGETDTSTGRWVPSTVKPYPTTTTDIAVLL